jgi:ATP-dependent RNA helicase DeaD
VATYTHRSGRPGRAGKTGTSIAIVHSRERGKLRDIEKRIGKSFERKEVPTPDHIIEKQLYNLADRIERVQVDDEQISKYFTGVERKLGWLSQQDLLKRVLSLEFNRLLDYYKDAPAIENIEERPAGRGRKEKDKNISPREKDRRTADPGMARVYVNAGKNDGFFAGNLIDILNRTIKGQRVDVGRIDLMPGYSLFDVKKGDARRVVEALAGFDFVGNKLYAEIADPEKDYTHASRRKKYSSDEVSGKPAKRKPAGNYDKFIKKGKKRK